MAWARGVIRYHSALAQKRDGCLLSELSITLVQRVSLQVVTGWENSLLI